MLIMQPEVVFSAFFDVSSFYKPNGPSRRGSRRISTEGAASASSSPAGKAASNNNNNSNSNSSSTNENADVISVTYKFSKYRNLRNFLRDKGWKSDLLFPKTFQRSKFGISLSE